MCCSDQNNWFKITIILLKQEFVILTEQLFLTHYWDAGDNAIILTR